MSATDTITVRGRRINIYTNDMGVWGWHAMPEYYDGAPDAHPYCRVTGHGSTEAEAVEDLADRIDELEQEEF